MVWVVVAAVVLVIGAGLIWVDLIDKTENIDPDEPCDFWMTED